MAACWPWILSQIPVYNEEKYKWFFKKAAAADFIDKLEKGTAIWTAPHLLDSMIIKGDELMD